MDSASSHSPHWPASPDSLHGSSPSLSYSEHGSHEGDEGATRKRSRSNSTTDEQLSLSSASSHSSQDHARAVFTSGKDPKRSRSFQTTTLFTLPESVLHSLVADWILDPLHPETFVQFALICKAASVLLRSNDIWRRLYEKRWPLEAAVMPPTLSSPVSGPREPSFRRLFRASHFASCISCDTPSGTFKVFPHARLCNPCWEQHNPQVMLAKQQSKKVFLLNEKDLSALPHAIVNRRPAPVYYFLTKDLVAKSIAKFGSIEALREEKLRRQNSRLTKQEQEQARRRTEIESALLSHGIAMSDISPRWRFACEGFVQGTDKKSSAEVLVRSIVQDLNSRVIGAPPALLRESSVSSAVSTGSASKPAVSSANMLAPSRSGSPPVSGSSPHHLSMLIKAASVVASNSPPPS